VLINYKVAKKQNPQVATPGDYERKKDIMHTAYSAAQQRGCVGRHLANRRLLRVSGSDSYALLFWLL